MTFSDDPKHKMTKQAKPKNDDEDDRNVSGDVVAVVEVFDFVGEEVGTAREGVTGRRQGGTGEGGWVGHDGVR